MSEAELRKRFGSRAVDALLDRIWNGPSPEIDPKLSAVHFGLQEETAIEFLEAASVARLVERRETQHCPACKERLEALDPEAELCPLCRKAFLDHGGVLTKVSYRVEANPPRAIPWVIVIHGFNTHGQWQQDFSWRIGNKLKYSAPVLIYKYGLIRFSVLVRWRHLQLAKQLGTVIRSAIAHAEANRIPEPPDVILHSFGSQLFVQLLAMPEFDDLKFGRIIATGAVIQPNYNWAERVSQGRLEAVLCHCGGKDWAVPFAQYFIPGTGPAARKGFSDVAAINVMNEDYGHGGCFELKELEANLAPGGLWDRFLRRQPSALDSDPKLFRPEVWRPMWAPIRGGVRVVAVCLMAALAALVLTWVSWAWLAVIEWFL
ncbi:hypothetical protein [Rhizobium redzepovicii]|uniref:hypothetical protein n=1 Tax=Rhizobium redzepovicii TaxID=2867518 RepID=UPI002871D91B|nr:hypothetical protein [Rhizobium redzepovicii]MDR9779611.1 hypothetical protein [Rhizobium redzepovicii]